MEYYIIMYASFTNLYYPSAVAMGSFGESDVCSVSHKWKEDCHTARYLMVLLVAENMPRREMQWKWSENERNWTDRNRHVYRTHCSHRSTSHQQKHQNHYRPRNVSGNESSPREEAEVVCELLCLVSGSDLRFSVLTLRVSVIPVSIAGVLIKKLLVSMFLVF